MSERVRGGLFNALGDIEGLSMLDGFAGSGALSFEAISRGALAVTAIDIDKKAFEAIKQSARELDIENFIKVIRASAGSWSDNNADAQFDIVIAAPPYDDLQPQLVAKLTRHVKPSGVFVLDWPGKQTALTFEGFEQITAKNYGDAQLIFYRLA
jgi:16S rRNA (guanine966-N2)-methyltransferase